MAKSIKHRTEHAVLGIDINPETMVLAELSGAIDGTLTDDKLAECDIVMIAIAPEALLKWAEEHAAQLRGVTLVDLCGVKRGICAELAKLAQMHGFSYVGGHPMAGKETSGISSATSRSNQAFEPNSSKRAEILAIDSGVEIGLPQSLQ